MKLLIVAGPYEADRIRRAAVSAGFEAVAVEPGESLSGWITATRPDVIILAPQIVNMDPAVALAKVRAVPRGRVPIFLVGEADEEAQLLPLADGFFVRPVSPHELLAKAHDAMVGSAPGATEGPDSGPQAAIRPTMSDGAANTELTTTAPQGTTPQGTTTKARALQPLVAARHPEPGRGTAVRDAAQGDGMALPAADEVSRVRLPAPGRRPSSRPAPAQLSRTTIFADLASNIEADFDAEISDVVRAVAVLRQARASEPALSVGSRGPNDNDAANELSDDSAHKTLEVPQAVKLALADSERAALIGGRTILAGSRAELVPAPVSDPDEIDLDLPSLLSRIYLSRLSGRLTLKQGTTRKHVVFERGHPVLAGSTLVEDRMGEMLVRQGRFTFAEMSACGAEVASSGRRLGVVLVERGLLKAADLSALVRRHYEEIIYSLFAWERGAWNLGTDNSATAEKILLSQHPAALILEGIRRKYDAERAETGLGGADRVFRLRLTMGAADLLEKMETTSEERNLVLLFDGVRSLREIQVLTRAPAERLYGVAWALFVLERLHVSNGPPDRETSSLSVRPDGISPGRDEAIDRAWVKARHALIMDGDYFQILGVSRSASGQEILRAHETMVAELAPGVLHAGVAADLAIELAEIRVVLTEAARLLADDGLRRLYREHLSPPPSPPPGSGLDGDAAF